MAETGPWLTRGQAVALVCAVALLAWWYRTRPVSHAPGVLVAEEPAQGPAPHAQPFASGEYRIQPLATFSLRGLVLHAERYRFDEGASLAPVDLALGWGRMSDAAVLDRLVIDQAMRWYSYRWSEAPPIAPVEIARSSANMHMVPANEHVRRLLTSVREGQLVKLSGYLIEVRAKNGATWRSSLTRDDTGAGACELVWVEQLAVSDE